MVQTYSLSETDSSSADLGKDGFSSDDDDGKKTNKLELGRHVEQQQQWNRYCQDGWMCGFSIVIAIFGSIDYRYSVVIFGFLTHMYMT